MDLEAFTHPNGRLVPLDGHAAFVPNPMPNAVDLSPQLVMALSKADRALGELAGLGRGMANPYLLIRLFSHREAVLSSKIEGTQTTFKDLAVYEAGQQLLSLGDSRARDDVQEVSNYIAALNFGLERVAELPVSLRLIRELHGRLMQGVRGQDKRPGEFRASQVWIGQPGAPMNMANYVPPPAPELDAALHAFELALHDDVPVPPLVRLALIHYQFETIHPFLDGNGRIGRLLVSLLLSTWQLLPQPLLYLSAFFEANRSAYYHLLMRVTTESSWEDWISFFLRGVESQALDALIRGKKLQDLREEFHRRVQAPRSSSIAVQLVDELFNTPAVTVSSVQKMLQTTYNTAQAHVQRLVKLGILTPYDEGSRRGRLYIASDIVDIVEAQTSA